MAKGEWQDLNPPERVRTYYFRDGSKAVFQGVTRLKVSESGTHYLETASGAKAIIERENRNWIDLDMDAWTF